MCLRSFASILALLMILAGCSSDESEERSDLVGRWKLNSYTLDDGSSKTVPDSATARIEIRDNGIISVAYLCGGYEASYTIADTILSTRDAVFPEATCDGVEGGADALERNQLLERVLLNTQTTAVVSDNDVLTVTAGSNEVLVFERADELQA